jgi:ActR/RegA family two-component response regulator
LEARDEEVIALEHCRGPLSWLANNARTQGALSRERIDRIMAESGNNKSLAARKLGVHRATLYRALDRGANSESAASPRV